MPWTADQILALAPDASSAKSGKDLSPPRKWKTLGSNALCAWGSIQGSGKDPYQISIDLSGPAFKCSCPSRKFPCKHGLGLFLVLVQHPASLTETTPPAWTSEWMGKRAEKEEKKTAKKLVPDEEPDAEAAAKAAASAERRAASRESKVTEGLEEVGIWLEDMVRVGFAALPGKPFSYWQSPAARLVDAQASGLARRVRSLDGITTTGEGWPKQLLRKISLLQLVREAWPRISSLSEPVQADLRATIGFPTNQEEVLQGSSLRDQWVVVGARIDEEERLRTQRTWLLGLNSRRPALCLSFSAGPNQPLDISLVPGTTIDADLAFYPGSWPVRALVKQRHGMSESLPKAFPAQNISEAIGSAAEALAVNPWLESVLFSLSEVTPLPRNDGWVLRDAQGSVIPMAITDERAWVLYSVSGGRPLALTGEWNGDSLAPLSVWSERGFLRI